MHFVFSLLILVFIVNDRKLNLDFYKKDLAYNKQILNFECTESSLRKFNFENKVGFNKSNNG
jgi:hypothetical protein